MKITAIELIEVRVPYIAPIRKIGHADWEHTIVKVHTDAGLTGLGEIWQSCCNVQPQAEARMDKNPLRMNLASANMPWQTEMYAIIDQPQEEPVGEWAERQCLALEQLGEWNKNQQHEQTQQCTCNCLPENCFHNSKILNSLST